MKATQSVLKLTLVVLYGLLVLPPNIQSAYGKKYLNTISFYNQSGEFALVKLVGPDEQTAEVPNGQSRTVNIAAGEYYILVRYGTDSEHYRYSKGDQFTVDETPTESSAVTITLHKIIGGNYPSTPITVQEFDQAILDKNEQNNVNLFYLQKDNINHLKQIVMQPSANLIYDENTNVLIRQLFQGVVALDGMMFLDSLNKVIDNVGPNLKENIWLVSVGLINYEKDFCSILKNPSGKYFGRSAEEWKTDPLRFDFVVDLTLDYNEHEKLDISSTLTMDVKETWKIYKVSTPSVSQMWSLSYRLRGEPAYTYSSPQYTDALIRQVETVIAPVRGPILKKVHSFIAANMN